MSDESTTYQVGVKDPVSGILVKLIVFTVMLGVVPIGSYFGTLNRVWHGNTTMAAITAIVSANVILLGYVLLSIFEDARTQKLRKEASKGPPEEDRKER